MSDTLPHLCENFSELLLALTRVGALAHHEELYLDLSVILGRLGEESGVEGAS